MKRIGFSGRVILALLIGAVGMALARWLRLPGGAFIGALVATGIARLLLAPLEQPPSWFRTAGRILLGLTIGASMTAQTVQAIGRALLPVSVMVVAMMLLGLAAAWAIYRATRMPLPTALTGTAPGALSGMVVLADELGGSGAVVASLHLVRLITVSLFVPAFVRLAFPHDGAILATGPVMAGAELPWMQLWLRLGILAVLGFVAGWAAARLKIPSGDLLAGMIVAALLNPAWLHLDTLPGTWRLLSQWVVGVSIGVTVTRDALRYFRPYLLAGGLMTVFMIGAGLALGWFLSRISTLDLVTCIVGCAPGGAETMMILATELGADAQLVAAMHISRMLILMVLLPALVRFAMGRRVASFGPLQADKEVGS